MTACSEEPRTMTPTHVAQVHLSSGQYPTLVNKLDAEMSKSGLSRFGATPGLSELHGRNVLYFEYRLNRADVWAFLVAHDVKKIGVVEVHIYSSVLKDEKARQEAISRVESVLAMFDAHLIIQQNSSSEKNK